MFIAKRTRKNFYLNLILAVLGLFMFMNVVLYAEDEESIIFSLERAFTKIAKKVKPSVVHLEVMKDISGVTPSEHPPFGPGAGSGVIIDERGYILTNNHVVADARGDIRVLLSNEKELTGSVVGTDPNTDLAVVKVEPMDKLPAATLGDSDKIEVGQWALAVGSPFGLEQTVTIGIISANHRRVGVLGSLGFEDFIQTDAAINPGNSGGPLVNSRGEVIGINSLISSRTGGSSGIGFAIPINMAKRVAETLIREGAVTRGFLGIAIRDVKDDEILKLKLEDIKGSLVTQVLDGEPAQIAGIREGDFIKTIDGIQIESTEDLRNIVSSLEVGSTVEVEFIRDGQEMNSRVTIGKMPSSVRR